MIQVAATKNEEMSQIDSLNDEISGIGFGNKKIKKKHDTSIDNFITLAPPPAVLTFFFSTYFCSTFFLLFFLYSTLHSTEKKISGS